MQSTASSDLGGGSCSRGDPEPLLSKQETEERVQVCLNLIQQGNDDQTVIAAYEIFLKFLQNIVSNPHEEKFRFIKKSNEVLKKKLFGIQNNPAVHELIINIGYTEMDDEVYGFDGTRFKQLFIAQGMIRRALDLIRVKYMSPEEKQRFEALERQRLEAIEEKQRKKEYYASL